VKVKFPDLVVRVVRVFPFLVVVVIVVFLPSFWRTVRDVPDFVVR
jgi:hypothetical protein